MLNTNLNPDEIYENLMYNIEIAMYLNQIKKYHYETYQHCLRVGMYTIKIAIASGLSEEETYLAGKAGLLHDIGKLKIEKEILDKTTNLTEFERNEIEKHARYSYELLENFSNEKIGKIVVMHHEFDSDHSYPRDVSKNNLHRIDLENGDILKIAEIVAVADVFDALTSQRNYKEEFSEDKVKNIMFNQNFFWSESILNTLFKL